MVREGGREGIYREGGIQGKIDKVGIKEQRVSD